MQTRQSRVAEAQAVALFVQRAQAARPQFLLTSVDREAVIALCRQAEGIPLAIELAAGRLRVLPLEKVRERLANRLALLAVDNSAVPQRQRTMRGTAEWSYALLTEPEQSLLRRLSVFTGGWTLEAAEAVGTKNENTLDLLTRLVESSLVMPDERFRMLEVTREFAHEKLRERDVEAQEVRQHHYHHFLRQAQYRSENCRYKA